MEFRKCIALVLTLCLLVFTLTACGDDSSDTAYEDYDEEATTTDDTSLMDTLSLDDITITEAFARDVHTAMQTHSFENYNSITSEEWKTMGEEERHQVYEAFFGILTDLGFSVPTEESTWIEGMDEDADFYTDYLIWDLAFQNLGFTGEDQLYALNSYIQGVDDGKYTSLHPEIFAAADDITVEYYEDQYLLCVGGNHNIAQLTKSWTTEESWFTQSGSVTPISTGDVFEDVSFSYSVGGSDGRFEEATFGEADLLLILKAIGAVAEDGTMQREQLQISAKSSFDAPQLFFLTQSDDGSIIFTVATYSEDDAMYVWDGKLFTTTERCCFDKDGNFCYIDNSGTLQTIAP